MFPQPQMLPQMSVKGYRELLKRLRNSNEEPSSSAVFQQAKERALAHLRQSRDTERLDPRRAFTRLRQRLLDTKAGLKELKDQKKERLRASYAAFLDKRLAKRGENGQEAAVLGQDGLLRVAVCGAVGLLSKGFMQLLNTTEAAGEEHLLRAMQRPASQGLVTVSNHAAALDDPLVLAALMPLESMARPADFRWGTCATDRCFKGPLMSAFFRAGKTLPVERGGGVNQAGMRAAEARLAAGDWIHIFPEGTRSADGKMGRMRRGIGHLVASSPYPPVVLPLVHSGMEGVLPRGAALPRVGQRIKVLVGEPIAVGDLTAAAKEEGWSQDQLTKAITQRVADALYSLKAQLDGTSVSEVVRDAAIVDSRALLPLVEAEMDVLSHSWRGCHKHKVPAISPPWAAGPVAGSLREIQLSLRRRLQHAKQLLGASGSHLEAVAEYFAANRSQALVA